MLGVCWTLTASSGAVKYWKILENRRKSGTSGGCPSARRWKKYRPLRARCSVYGEANCRPQNQGTTPIAEQKAYVECQIRPIKDIPAISRLVSHQAVPRPLMPQLARRTGGRVGPLSPSVTGAACVEDPVTADSLPRAQACTEPARAIFIPRKPFVLASGYTIYSTGWLTTVTVEP